MRVRGRMRGGGRRLGAAVAAAVAAALAAAGAAPASAGSTTSTGQEAPSAPVLLITVPALTWADVAAHRPPTLLALAEGGAVASTSVRTVGADTSPGEGYATIGAGNRATVLDDLAGQAWDADTELEGDPAITVLRRRVGEPVDGAVVHTAIAAVVDRNESLAYGAETGSLGEAIETAGHTVAVVGNADLGPVSDPRREVALAAVDAQGAVAAGVVGQELLADDPDAPYGVRLDGDAVTAAVAGALERSALVVVEMSDLARVDAAAAVYRPEAHARAEASAIAGADRLIADLLDIAGPEATVMVVTPYPPSGPDQLGVFVLAGPEAGAGWARSATTRRPGYVTLPDIAPTVLDRLGIEVPDAMTGTAVTSVGDRPPGWLGELVDQNLDARFRDRVFTGVTSMFVILQLVTYALTAVAVVRRGRRWRLAARAGLLLILAFPPLAYLSGLFDYRVLGEAGYPAALVGAAAVVAAGALAVSRRSPLVPLALASVTLAVLVADVLAGGGLQINTVFGYSPIVAGRFAGFGNQAFALVSVAAIVALTGWWAVAGGRRPATAAVALAFAGVVAVIGHPALGSDVGGVLASVPAFAATVLVLAGRRLTARRVAALGLAAAVVVTGFALVDLARPAAEQTHLGRFVSDLADPDAVGEVLSRKLSTNASILTSSIWSLLVAVAIVFLGWLAWRPAGALRVAQARTPGLRAALLGSLVAGGLGFALNDSGVAVPAMMLSIVLPWAGWHVLDTVGTGVGSGAATPATAAADEGAHGEALAPARSAEAPTGRARPAAGAR